ASHNWFGPALWQVLCSPDRGFFYWTPLALLAFAGYLFTKRNPFSALLVAAFLLQVYVLASLWGAGVYLGVAYGFRHLTESVVLLAPGLAILLDRVPDRWLRYAIAAGASLVLWNSILVAAYRYGVIPADSGGDLPALLAGAWRIVQRKR